MSSEKIIVGDIGTRFIVTITDNEGAVDDISDATNIEFVFSRPDGTQFTKDAAFTTDGTDGVVEYLFTQSYFTIAGCWTLVVVITFSATSRFSSSTIRFNVHD